MTVEAPPALPEDTALTVKEDKKFVYPIIEEKKLINRNRHSTLKELKDHFSSTAEGSVYAKELQRLQYLVELDNK